MPVDKVAVASNLCLIFIFYEHGVCEENYSRFQSIDDEQGKLLNLKSFSPKYFNLSTDWKVYMNKSVFPMKANENNVWLLFINNYSQPSDTCIRSIFFHLYSPFRHTGDSLLSPSNNVPRSLEFERNYYWKLRPIVCEAQSKMKTQSLFSKYY